jgi:hypothetical protein
VHLTYYCLQKEEPERGGAARIGMKVPCNTHTWPANRKKRLEDLRTRLTIQNDGRRHVQETRWQFRTYDAAQMRALLAKVPAFELVACYDFTYDLLSPRELDDSYADVVLILKKK